MSDKSMKTVTVSKGCEKRNTLQRTEMVPNHGLVDPFSLNNSDPTMVFIYDMMTEIVTMPVNEKCEQLYPDVNPLAINELFKRLLINMDFFDDFEKANRDFVNIEETVDDDDDDDDSDFMDIRKDYPKYDVLRRIYNGYLDGFKMNGTVMENDVLLLKKGESSEQEEKLCRTASQLLNAYNGQWAKQCFELVKKRSTETGKKHANVILSDHGLIGGAIELILAGHNSSIPIENIYSSINGAKTSHLMKIQEIFGKECTFVVVTSNPETVAIAEKLKIHCWPIRSDEDIKMLYTTQRDVWLK